MIWNTLFLFAACSIIPELITLRVTAAIAPQTYSWANVKIGGGGGFVPGIVFNPSEKGLAYLRTDIGGAYRLNPSDDTWTPLLVFADDAKWNYWGVDALATDPVDTDRVYLVSRLFPSLHSYGYSCSYMKATGIYTNSWDPNNGQILISTDRGNTWTASKLSFKASRSLL